MATIKLVPSTYYLSSSSYLSVSNASSMYTDTDSTTYATVTNSRNSTSSYYIYLRGFNFSDIPSGAVVSNFTIRLKGNYSNGYTNSMYLYNGTDTSVGSANSLSSSVATQTFSVTATWDELVAIGSDLGIRINCRRSSRNKTSYVYIYGAEIEVEYTLPNPVTVSSILVSGEGVIDPEGSITTYEGNEYTLTITPVDMSNEVTVVQDGVDVTNQVITHYPSSEPISTNLGTYTLVSGSFSSYGSGDSYFSGIVGNGEDASTTTSSYYSSSSGTIAVFTYDMNITNLPSNAVISRVYCNVSGHAESTSNSNEYMCVQLISGNTALTEEINYKDVGTSNTIQTLECTTLPTVAQLASMQLQCRIGYYGGAINGATVYVEYSLPSSDPDYYYYTYIVGSSNSVIEVTIGSAGPYIPPEEDPEKTYYSLTISSINATTDPSSGTTRVESGTNQTVTITPSDPQLTLALDNGVDITDQLVGGIPTNTYTITTQVSGASYGFNLNSSTGYYVSSNDGVSRSASVARINMEFESDCLVTIQYINYAEENYDYGMFGKLDTAVATDGLSASSGSSSPSDSTSNYQLAMCSNSTSTQTISYEVSAGTHFIDVKYGKDDASDSGNDNLQWKILSVEATSAGGEYTYTLTNITQKHSLIFIFGDVSYYFVTSAIAGEGRAFPDGQQVVLEGGAYILNIVPDSVSAQVTLTDNGTDVTSQLEQTIGTDKFGNPAVSYKYNLSNISAAHTLSISIGGATAQIYIKENGSWVAYSKVYLKVNGSWVEQDSTTWSTLFNTSTNYRAKS